MSPPIPSPPGPVRVGVIGLGFMGAAHIRAYAEAAATGHPCRLVAVADHTASRLADSEVPAFADPADLLALPDLDLVSICTPTDSHVDIAIAALRAGKHVLVEKPVSLHTADIQRLAAVARETGRLCMPAMCMRFWPGWDWLRERIRDGEHGRVLSATFQRLGSAPAWNTPFYTDHARSGGPLFDLHIHDADFILWCFGPPREVLSTGSPAHLTTLYRYDAPGPAHITAEAGQDHAPGFPFRMRYTVVFETATADWDLSRTPPLLLCPGGRAEEVPLPPGAGYAPQACHIIDAVARGAAPSELRATLDDALAVTHLLHAERRGL